LLAAAVCVTGFAKPARADALLDAAMKTFDSKSYHMQVMATDGVVTEVDVVVPDRLHLINPKSEMIVIGSTLYLKQGGSWRQIPGQGTQVANIDVIGLLHKNYTDIVSTDLGMKAVDGAQMHAIRVNNPKTQAVWTVYIDGAGRIARIDSDKAVVRITKFGEPINISAPI
jgi:hypothetical protein